MNTTRYFIYIGLLAFLPTQVLTQGILGALSRPVISPQTRTRKGCSPHLLKPSRRCINRAAKVPAPEPDKKKIGGTRPDPSDYSDDNDSLRPGRDKHAGCPEDFVGFGDTCYKLVTSRSSWRMAKAYCRFSYDGGDLASISSREEYDFIKQQFSGRGGDLVWTGMHKKTFRGPFRWVNGEEVVDLPFGPTDSDLTKGFVAMALDKYKFRLIESSQRQFHFLCSTPRLNEETESVQSVPADNFPQKPLPGVSVAEKPEQSSFKSASPEKEDTNVARKSATAATDPMPSTSDTKEPDADATHSVSTKADRDSSAEPDSQEQDLLTVKVASNSVTSRTDGTEDSDICIPDAELVAKDSVTSITDGAQVAEDPVTRIYDAKKVAQDSVTGVPDTKQFVRDSVTSAPDTKQVTERKFTSLSDAEQTVKSSKKSGQENAIDGEMGDVVMSGNGAVEQPSQPVAGWKEFEDQYYKAFYTRSTFQEASWSCLMNDAQLVSIHSERENAFIKSEVMIERPNKSHWLGLASARDGWHWTDGSAVDYTRLVSQTKDLDRKGRQDSRDLDTMDSAIDKCFAISGPAGEWTPFDCERKLIFICRKAKDEGVPQQDKNGHIPPDAGHADKPPVFAGTQKSTSAKSEGGHIPSAPSILVAVAGLVVVLTITAIGVTGWYRQNTKDSVAWRWSRLPSEKTSPDQASRRLHNASQYLALEDSEIQTVDDNHLNVYGTIAQSI